MLVFSPEAYAILGVVSVFPFDFPSVAFRVFLPLKTKPPFRFPVFSLSPFYASFHFFDLLSNAFYRRSPFKVGSRRNEVEAEGTSPTFIFHLSSLIIRSLFPQSNGQKSDHGFPALDARSFSLFLPFSSPPPPSLRGSSRPSRTSPIPAGTWSGIFPPVLCLA